MSGLQELSWQLQSARPEWVSEAVTKAARVGIQRVQLSHNLIMYAEQLWDGEGSRQRAALLRRACRQIRSLGMKADLWTHEISSPPASLLRGNRVVLDEQTVSWLQDKYARVAQILPELDGLVLTYSETSHPVYMDASVADERGAPDRIGWLTHVMVDICRRHGWTLYIRPFVHRPIELQFMTDAMRSVADQLPRDGSVVVMEKCVPHDWHPYYPYHPLLGRVHGLPQVVEVDMGQEYTGLSHLLHYDGDYVANVMKFARDKGCVGAVCRIERMDWRVFGTPNEVNIDLFSILSRDPERSASDELLRWCAARYGARAAAPMSRILTRTHDTTNMTLFPLGEWLMDHSRLPRFEYAFRHVDDVKGYSVARWIDSPHYQRRAHQMRYPDEDVVRIAASEKNLARTLVRASQADLQSVKDALPRQAFDEWRNQLVLAQDALDVCELHHRSFFRALRWRNLGDSPASQAERRQLAQWVRQDMTRLTRMAALMARRWGGGIHPVDSPRIERYVNDLNTVLRGA